MPMYIVILGKLFVPFISLLLFCKMDLIVVSNSQTNYLLSMQYFKEYLAQSKYLTNVSFVIAPVRKSQHSHDFLATTNSSYMFFILA